MILKLAPESCWGGAGVVLGWCWVVLGWCWYGAGLGLGCAVMMLVWCSGGAGVVSGCAVVAQIESVMEQEEAPDSLPLEALRAILDPTAPPTTHAPTPASPPTAAPTPDCYLCPCHYPAPAPAPEAANPAVGALLSVLEEQGQGLEEYRWATVRRLLGRYLDSEEAFHGHTLVSALGNTHNTTVSSVPGNTLVSAPLHSGTPRTLV